MQMQQVSVAAGFLSSSSSSIGSFFRDTARARFLTGEGGLSGGLDERVRLLVRHGVLSGELEAVLAASTALDELDRMDAEMVGGLNRPAPCKEPSEAIPSEGRKALTKMAGVIVASGDEGEAIPFQQYRVITLNSGHDKRWFG